MNLGVKSSDTEHRLLRRTRVYAYHPTLRSECLDAELVVLLVTQVECCTVLNCAPPAVHVLIKSKRNEGEYMDNERCNNFHRLA